MATNSVHRAWSSMKGLAHAFQEARVRAAEEAGSPVPHLLRSNEAPSDEQRDAIKCAIQVANAELVDVGQQTRANPSNKALLRHCETLIEYVAVHSRILAPWRRLPEEMLMEVFSHFIPPKPSEPSIAAYVFISQVPGRCRRVCKRWHAAIHALPELFSYLPKVDLNKKTEGRHYIKMLNQRLEWSRGAPLRVILYAPFIEYESHPALDAVMAHASRWDLLHVEVTFPTLRPLSKVKRHLKSLHFLTLDIWRYEHPNEGVAHDLFSHAHHLESVAVNGVFPEGLILPWANLKTYRENVLERGGLKKVSLECPLLESLDVDEKAGLTLEKPATLPNLKKLRFHRDSNRFDTPSTNTPINQLVLPALEDAIIFGAYTEMLPMLHDLVIRSSCGNLRTLAFASNNPMVPGKLTQLLYLIPKLSELRINFIPDLDLRYLIGNDLGAPLVPELKRLRIHPSPERGILPIGKADLYRSLVESRCGSACSAGKSQTSHCRLEEFRLVFDSCPYLISEAQERLEGWDNEAICDSATTCRASGLKAKLQAFWPGLGDGIRDHTAFTWKSRPGSSSAERLDTTFLEVERLDITDVQTLQLSRLHLVVKAIAQLPLRAIPSEKKYGIKRRAETLLQRWRPLLSASVVRMHWVKVGKYSVIYISDNNEIRKSAEEGLVFGLDDTVHDADLLWLRASANTL